MSLEQKVDNGNIHGNIGSPSSQGMLFDDNNATITIKPFSGVVRHARVTSVSMDDMEYLNHQESSCDKICHMLPMFHPKQPIRVIWDFIICITLTFSMFEIPITLAWDIRTDLRNSFGRAMFVIDMILLTDIIIQFRTAKFDKYDEVKLITDWKDISWNYITGWFFIDFFTSLPFSVMIRHDLEVVEVAAGLRLVRILRILKILRIIRVIPHYNSMLSYSNTKALIFGLKLVKLVILMFFGCHFAACIWFAVGMHSYDTNIDNTSWIKNAGIRNDTIYNQYITSLYWSTVTLFTTGFGDIVPSNPAEKIVSIVFILVGTLVFAFLINEIGLMVKDGDIVSQIISQKNEETKAFCRTAHLSKELTHAVISHAKYYYKKNFIFDCEKTIKSLPNYVVNEIGSQISKRYFKNVKIFDHLNDYIKGLISLKLKSISCNSNHNLYNIGDSSQNIYILRTGVSIICYNNGKTLTLKRGDICGIDSIVKTRCNSTVKCLSWCEWYVLDINDIKDILKDNYPQKWEKKWKIIQTSAETLISDDPHPDLTASFDHVIPSHDINNPKTYDKNTPETAAPRPCMVRCQRGLLRNNSFYRNKKIINQFYKLSPVGIIQHEKRIISKKYRHNRPKLKSNNPFNDSFWKSNKSIHSSIKMMNDKFDIKNDTELAQIRYNSSNNSNTSLNFDDIKDGSVSAHETDTMIAGYNADGPGITTHKHTNSNINDNIDTNLNVSKPNINSMNTGSIHVIRG